MQHTGSLINTIKNYTLEPLLNDLVSVTSCRSDTDCCKQSKQSSRSHAVETWLLFLAELNRYSWYVYNILCSVGSWSSCL